MLGFRSAVRRSLGIRRFAKAAEGGKPAAPAKPISKVPPKAEKSGGSGAGSLVGLVVFAGLGYNAYMVKQLKSDPDKLAQAEVHSPQMVAMARKIGVLPAAKTTVPAAAAAAATAA